MITHWHYFRTLIANLSLHQNITELNESKNHQKGILVKRLNKKLKSLEEELVARHQVNMEVKYTF